jgi:hypothetical protein
MGCKRAAGTRTASLVSSTVLIIKDDPCGGLGCCICFWQDVNVSVAALLEGACLLAFVLQLHKLLFKCEELPCCMC